MPFRLQWLCVPWFCLLVLCVPTRLRPARICASCLQWQEHQSATGGALPSLAFCHLPSRSKARPASAQSREPPAPCPLRPRPLWPWRSPALRFCAPSPPVSAPSFASGCWRGRIRGRRCRRSGTRPGREQSLGTGRTSQRAGTSRGSVAPSWCSSWISLGLVRGT